jgi:putative RecB family exonuclease
LRLPEQTVGSSLVFGTAVHRVVEAHFQALLQGEAVPGLDTLLGFFWDSWHAEQRFIRLNKNETLDTIGDQADRMLRVFQQSDSARPEGRIIGIEEELRGVFSENCPEFLSRVDLLIEMDDVLVVIDFKTARYRWNLSRLDQATPQLLVYSELSDDLADGRPVQLVFAVLTKAKKPILTQHPVLWDNDRLETVRQTVDDVWRAIQARSFFAIPSPAHCPRCPFQDSCLAWRG